MRGVAQEVHDDGALLNSFLHFEKVGPCYPAVLLRLFPACAIFPYTNDYIETVVTEIEPLTVTLRAVADEREGIVFEVVLHGGVSA